MIFFWGGGSGVCWWENVCNFASLMEKSICTSNNTYHMGLDDVRIVTELYMLSHLFVKHLENT